MSKRILIISHCFAPQNKVGAVRSTKLVKYLLRMGHEVTVLAGKGVSSVTDPLLAKDLSNMNDVYMIRERSLLRWWKERGASSSAPGNQSGGKQAGPAQARPMLNAIYLFLDGRADAAFARACVRKARRMGKRYDVVLSSYGPPSVHIVANKIKQSGLANQWIADFRDEAAVPFAWQKPGLKRYCRMITRNADCVTAISAGLLRVMGMEDGGRVVFNGFDPEDISGFTAPPKRTDKLTFIHCGQMYGLQRDLSPFFRALSELISEGMIAADSVALVYAGADTRGFIKQAGDAGLPDCLEGHGFIPRDESLKLQKSAHVLLLPAWNLKNRQGNVPGKLLEYMMLDMPVICCVSGEVPHSEIAGILRDTNLGICYEQANQTEDTPRLKAYIADVIRAFQNGDSMPFAPDRDAINGFTSEGMARKMANIIEELTD